jgi:hypothetical protein
MEKLGGFAGTAEADSGSSLLSKGGQTRPSVSKQVSLLVQEATSFDNLSRMYEGWSAWI